MRFEVGDGEGDVFYALVDGESETANGVSWRCERDAMETHEVSSARRERTDAASA